MAERSATAVKIEVEGLRDFIRELKKLDRKWPREMTKVHSKAAKLVAGRARKAAPAKVRRAIRARANVRSAWIMNYANPPHALVVFWGTKRRTGWYAAERFEGSGARQHVPWVGNQWDPGEAGGTPYHIGPAINDSVDDVIEIVGDGIDDVVRRAFPS